jgi:Na+-transporting NADH:ubiquinone oxidoreductase subunit NqrC
MKKTIFLVIVLFLGSSLMVSQDLVEAAKKEKERRAQLKKKSTVVVTNANLHDTQRQATIRATQPGDQTQAAQGTTPQTVQRAAPSTPTPPQKRASSQQIDNIDQMDIRVDQVEQLDQLDTRGFRSDYATQVLFANQLVRNPASALDKPDGIFAEIPRLGVLDLQISVRNGPGDDIAIYALHAGAQSVAPGGEEEGGIPQIVTDFYGEGLWYGVLGMEEQGDWVEIGKGSGMNSPEKFDLGELTSIKKIRIMFKQFSNIEFPAQFNRAQANENIFRIDAVETLHK